MRIVFNIDVGIDVPSFVQAGEILDKISRDLGETIGDKGTYDIAQFRTHHNPVRRRSSEPSQNTMAERPYADSDLD